MTRYDEGSELFDPIVGTSSSDHELARSSGGAPSARDKLGAPMEFETRPALSSLVPPASPTFRIVVTSGPDRGSELALDENSPARLLVGTSPACALRLSDPLVSRRHLALEITANGLRVTDLQSTNGSSIRGVSIIEARLVGGEVVNIGDSSIEIHAGAAGPRLPSRAVQFGRVVGKSPEMRRLYPVAERLAATSIPLLIEGETGTGKELLAESIHDASPRARGPFLVFDCTTVAPTLVESELFGHERGAFTGASTARKGAFEQASGGTLFIDEIGDLDPSLQPKLLRAIERGEIRPVGGDRWIKVDVRIIAATRRDLDAAVQSGRFRDDLFYRIAVGRLELPPLRARAGDIEFLTQYLWEQMAPERPLPEALRERFGLQPWPGNVRELNNAIARYIALDGFEQPPPSASATSASDDYIDRVIAHGLPLPVGRQRVIEEYEHRYIVRTLAKFGGHVGKAANALGIGRRYFQAVRNRSSREE